jgi:Mor family transcriptional regulator
VAFDRDVEPHNLTTAERDQRIRQRLLAGESLSTLSREYGISPQRVWQIVNQNPGTISKSG